MKGYDDMNHIDQKIETALERVTLSQSAKYRVKNKIQSAVSHPQNRVRGKRSAAAVVGIALASLLVISAAAIGGLTYFHAIYGDKAETLTPYGITIGTSAQNEDIVLTLHESVADDYATAYIFSIEGLTDKGKALVATNTLDQDAYETAFVKVNNDRSVYPDDKLQDMQGHYILPTVIPPEVTDCKLYNVYQITPSGERKAFDIGLRLEDVTYDTLDNTAYTIIPIEALREENCEYYALYVITPETHQFTLTFDELELPLPEATTRIPGIEVIFDGYIEDYYLNEGGLSKIMSEYPTSAVLTPLGLYVNDSQTRLGMYMSATLVFNDGCEQYLTDISNEKSCVVSWKLYYFTRSYQGAVYLFNEIMDVSTVKSLLFYDEIEFPVDGSAPFVRSSGRILDPNNPQLLWWKIQSQIRDYIIETCPDSQYVWKISGGVSNTEFYYGYKIFNSGSLKENNSTFFIHFSDLSGGTLEEEARAMVEKLNDQKRGRFGNDLTFNVTGTGVFNGIDVLVVECGETSPGLYKRCIFALVEGKLLTIEYDGYTGQPTDYAFDALLDLITFN